MHGPSSHRVSPADGARARGLGWLRLVACLAAAACGWGAKAAPAPSATRFHKSVEPILKQYCYDCHGDGMNKGGVAFDGFGSDQALLANREVWWKVLRNLRAGLMPPQKKARPGAQEKERIETWIKSAVFASDPKDPDPGRVTVRRLNRAEYRNTVRDLTGVDYNTGLEFPPDDAGYGFDNIGDVLTLSPMLLEKYLAAARTIVKEALGAAATPMTAKDQQAGRPSLFSSSDLPKSPAERSACARSILRRFAGRAFRRPVDEETVKRLEALAEQGCNRPGETFETGLAQALVAVLASPRFLFREEETEPAPRGQTHPLVDEYALASRLSYFLWSSMPDDESFRLAGEHKLRANVGAQLSRMLADSRSRALVRNFTGQWLQARDVEDVDIEPRAILARERTMDPAFERRRARFRELRAKPEGSLSAAEKDELEKVRAEVLSVLGRFRMDFGGDLRQAMRRETEKYFEYIVRQDRPVVELIESDYTFLNERLAKLYGIDGVAGDEWRRVELPPDSPRGGILGQGTVLVVTSNPTRTSPVKRGLFILDNVLGMPPPPPPPNIPPLEDAAKDFKGHEPTLRETLAAHRNQPLCSSCHSRMDPLGLALENFNALGMWRERERDQPIDVTGTLITGESFANVRELKHILATQHRRDFYRCLTEKLLTYALGRGLDYYDVETVDQIVARLEGDQGRFSALLTGIVESAPFQKCRKPAMLTDAKPVPQAPL